MHGKLRKRAGAALPRLNDHELEDEESATFLVPPSKLHGQRRQARPSLVVMAGGSAGEMYRLRQSETAVGRSETCGIRFEDKGISRRHALILSLGKQVTVEDLGSANGTFVNGEMVTSKRVLSDGDEIALGAITALKFTCGAGLRDGPTGAYSKRYFLDQLTKELAIATRHGTPLSFVMLELDRLEDVKDGYGHLAVDAVLVKLARLVTITLGTESVFARYGAEAFAILCPSTDGTDAAVVAERLREQVAAMRVYHDGHEIAVTVSLGVACNSDVQADGPARLIAEADAALHQAKQDGGDRWVLQTQCIRTRPTGRPGRLI
jgi:diguanylate cyclase (GGDEF)-like protein